MEKQKKILVLCGGKFAFKSLWILTFEKFLCGIGIGKGEETIVNGLQKESEKNGIPFKSFTDKASLNEMREWIDSIQPDYIFSISFPFLIPEKVLSYGSEKFINFHPGPLPSYRGPMPLFEVLRYQETETAVSVHFMSEQFDDGNLLFCDPIQIAPDDTYGKLAVKLSEHTAYVVQNVANMLQFATQLSSMPQEESLARYFERPEPEDTFIHWKHMPSDEIVSLINACNPWNIGADTLLKGENVKIISALRIEEAHQSHPGTILSVSENGAMHVACSDNTQLAIDLLSTDYGIMSSKQFTGIQSVVGHSFN